jgi:hypothetical protein
MMMGLKLKSMAITAVAVNNVNSNTKKFLFLKINIYSSIPVSDKNYNTGYDVMLK